MSIESVNYAIQLINSCRIIDRSWFLAILSDSSIAAATPAGPTIDFYSLFDKESIQNIRYQRVKNSYEMNRQIIQYKEFAMSEVELLESIEQSAQMDEKDRHYAKAGKALRELSHALKNILQMVGGATEVIDYAFQLKQMDKVEKSWPILSQNVKRMKKNLMDILDYTKKQNLEKCSCNLNEELKRVLNSLKSVAQVKKFKLQAQLDAGLPEVNIDPERIGLMTLNMLLNAIDQVPEEGGMVTIQTRYIASESQFEICVSDNGDPYTPEFQKQIFTPHETHKQRFSTGIGMMLAQQIANQHEGVISVHCSAGQNSLSAMIPIKD